MGRPPQAGAARSQQTKIRLSPAEKTELEVQAAARGFSDLSAYTRHLIQQDGKRLDRERGRA